MTAMLAVPVAVALPGCSLDNPRDVVPIGETGTALTILRQQQERTRDLVQVGAAGLSDVQLTTLTWVDACLTAHLAVLQSPDPRKRQTSTSRNQTPTASGTAEPVSTSHVPAAFEALRQAFSESTAVFTQRANGIDGVASLVWASLAAFGSATHAMLPTGSVHLDSAQPVEAPVELSARDAMVDVIARAHELTYGTEVAIGNTTIGSPTRTDLEAERIRWLDVADTLSDLLRSAGGTPPDPGYSYAVPRPASAGEAYALVGGLNSAMLVHLGRLVVATDDTAVRTLVVPTLVETAARAAAWGGTVWRWPGWPTA